MRAEEVEFKQTEAQFMRQVRRYAELTGWRVYFTHDSRHSPSGFPDLVLVRSRHPKPRVVFAELKSERGQATDAQIAWLGDLRACGAEAYLWRPSMWRQIEENLR